MFNLCKEPVPHKLAGLGGSPTRPFYEISFLQRASIISHYNAETAFLSGLPTFEGTKSFLCTNHEYRGRIEDATIRLPMCAATWLYSEFARPSQIR